MQKEDMGGPTSKTSPELHHVNFSGFLAFKPPPRVRADVHKMIYVGCYTADVHPSTWKFLSSITSRSRCGGRANDPAQ